MGENDSISLFTSIASYMIFHKWGLKIKTFSDKSGLILFKLLKQLLKDADIREGNSFQKDSTEMKKKFYQPRQLIRKFKVEKLLTWVWG